VAGNHGFMKPISRVPRQHLINIWVVMLIVLLEIYPIVSLLAQQQLLNHVIPHVYHLVDTILGFNMVLNVGVEQRLLLHLVPHVLCHVQVTQMRFVVVLGPIVYMRRQVRLPRQRQCQRALQAFVLPSALMYYYVALMAAEERAHVLPVILVLIKCVTMQAENKSERFKFVFY